MRQELRDDYVDLLRYLASQDLLTQSNSTANWFIKVGMLFRTQPTIKILRLLPLFPGPSVSAFLQRLVTSQDGDIVPVLMACATLSKEPGVKSVLDEVLGHIGRILREGATDPAVLEAVLAAYSAASQQ